jgi:hypothetical protein
MKKTALVLALSALGTAACSGDGSMNPADPQQAAEETASSSAALTSTLPPGVTLTYGDAVTIGSCHYQIGWGQAPTPLPPPYVVYVHKTALAATCTTTGYQQIGTGYTAPNPHLFKASNSALVATLITKNVSPASPHDVSLFRLKASDLTTELSGGIAIPPINGNPPNSTIDYTDVVLESHGDIKITGTKVGTFPGELGPGGSSYIAIFNAIATTTSGGPTWLFAW